MKKAYLLVGSFGLLGAMAQIAPVLAETGAGTPQEVTAETTALISGVPIAATKDASNALLALEPSKPATPSRVAQAAPVPAAASLLAANLVKADSLAQVTSVSELSDVKPTDWAFQAVQSLVERYGCIEGYPDRTFRGNRAATRYELAAALNACLNQISSQLGGLTAEDLATIKRLQDEFAAELATLRGRVDALEARTTELEANQFSTTTQLTGQVIVAPTYGEAGDLDSRATVLTRVRLIFNTSFTGDDLLYTQLQVGNLGEDILGVATAPLPRDPAADVGPEEGPNFSELTVPGDITYTGIGTTTFLNKLYYTFNVGDDFSFTIGPRLYAFDFADASTYAYDEARDFSSSFFINNPLIMPNVLAFYGGAGAAFSWSPGGGPITLRGVYQAGSPTNALASSTGGGLFGDPYQATGEIEFSPGDYLSIKLQYTNAAIFDTKYNSYGVNAEATFGRFGIFGRYGIGDQTGYGPLSSIDGLTANPETFMAGVAVRDLFREGSLLGLAAGQPYAGEDLFGDATQTNYEAFYSFPVNDNITVTPTISVITDPLNDSANPTVYQGTLRTVFTF